MAYGIDGAVEARMDAYRGQPERLQQQYAQKQELIDLLALQKLKSEKEAAARDMQLKMAQQQAAQGQPPTIKDQREQEVMNMTKQEMAQQVGGLMQQRQQEQAKRMQQLMQSGIASAPAPNVARMAGGGIVAFAEGGGTFDEFLPEEREEVAVGPVEVPEELTGKVGLAQIKDIREGKYGRTKQEILASFGIKPQPAAVAAPAPAPAAETKPEAAGITAALAKPTPPVAPVAPTAPSGIAAAAPATDPLAMQANRQKEVTGLLSLTPEQRKVYDENIAGLRGLYKEEMDPEARRERQLSAFLRGAGGRSSFGSVMGGASGAAEAERQRGFRESVKGTEAIQKKLEDVVGIERGAVKEGITAGTEAGRLGGQMRGQDIQSRDKALDRKVEEQKISVQREANEALRDQNNFQRLQGTLQNVNRAIAQIEQAYMKSPQYGGQLATLQMQLQAAKGDEAKKIRQQMADIQKEMDAVVARASGDLVRQRDAIEAAMASSGGRTGAFKVEKIK